MKSLIVVTAALGLFAGGWPRAVAQSKPAFEVVSIKAIPMPASQTLQDRQANRPVFNLDASRLEIRNSTLTMILRDAFNIDFRQIAAPDFAGQEYFDVQAKLPAGATRVQVGEMLQTMFAERFQLAYHRENREYLTTVITVAKSGIKLTRLPDDAPTPPQSRVRLPDGTTRITTVGTITALFPVMNSFGGFPQSVDETGLNGRYTWVQDQAPASPDRTFQETVHDSYAAMMEAAGLKLDIRRVPRETIVVDHLEKMPTEN